MERWPAAIGVRESVPPPDILRPKRDLVPDAVTARVAAACADAVLHPLSFLRKQLSPCTQRRLVKRHSFGTAEASPGRNRDPNTRSHQRRRSVKPRFHSPRAPKADPDPRAG
jgi:hypothetical protein